MTKYTYADRATTVRLLHSFAACPACQTVECRGVTVGIRKSAQIHVALARVLFKYEKMLMRIVHLERAKDSWQETFRRLGPSHELGARAMLA